jgi:hypothetical protein
MTSVWSTQSNLVSGNIDVVTDCVGGGRSIVTIRQPTVRAPVVSATAAK